MSNTQKDPKNPGYTPGWNDPPTYQYNTQIEQKTNILNKRVAFPLSKPTGQPPVISSDGGLLPTTLTPPSGVAGALPKVSPGGNLTAPPLPQSSCNVVSPDKVTTVLKESASESDFDSKLKNVMEVFDRQLESDEIKSKASELKKRITVMENAWKDGKLSANVKRRLINISEEISAGDFETAEVICRSVVIDYNNEVSSWIVAIRQIIQSSK